MNTPNHAQLVLRCTRGLEWVAAAEAVARCGAVVNAVRHRSLLCTVPSITVELLGLRVADDVLVFCGEVGNVSHQRRAIAELADAVGHLPLRETLSSVQSVRSFERAGDFDVVTSIRGGRNYNRSDIEGAVGAVIASRTGMRQVHHGTEEVARSVLSWRLHLEDDTALIMLRLGRVPTHRRAYKTESLPGALHAPVAAALVLLAGVSSETVLLDPFAGSGTIPIEACGLEPLVVAMGSDLSSEAVSIARRNALRASANASFFEADAADLPLESSAVSCCVCNPPWSRAVMPAGGLAEESRGVAAELERVLHPTGRAVILALEGDPLLASIAARGAFRVVHRQKISLFGSWPEILVLDALAAGARPLGVPGTRYAEAIEATYQAVWPIQMPL